MQSPAVPDQIASTRLALVLPTTTMRRMSEKTHAGLRPTNRSAAIISPKVPFLDWARTAFKDGTPPPGLPNRARVFLLPKTGSDQEGRDYVLVECASIFADMLAGWNSDRSTWPGDLDSCGLFTAWFDVQIVLMVVDMVPDEALAG